MNCGICGGALDLFKNLYDDRYGYPGNFNLYVCKACGHKQLDAQFSTKKLSTMYTKFYPRACVDLDQFKPCSEKTGFHAWLDGVRSAAFRWVPHNVRVLDIGCGYGETIGYHLARDCEAYGVEADENIKKVACKFGYKIHIGLFDPNIYAANYFDYVTLDQVIEHLTDPLKALRDIATVLRTGGQLIVATPNSNGWGASVFGSRWLSWHAPYHLQLFSRTSMAHLARQSGFSLEKAMTITSSDYLHMQWGHLFMRSAPGEKSVFWVPNISPNWWQNIALKIMHIMYKYKVDHALTRPFDALNIGDNYLFFLRKI